MIPTSFFFFIKYDSHYHSISVLSGKDSSVAKPFIVFDKSYYFEIVALHGKIDCCPVLVVANSDRCAVG